MNLLRLLLAIPLSAASGSAETLPMRTYTAADGLGSSFVTHISQDSAGYLWFSTRDGLSRYDGYEFTTYGRESGLPIPTISCCLQTRRGDYIILTNDGRVYRWTSRPAPAGGRRQVRPLFTVVTHPPGSDGGLSRLSIGPTGTIWGGADNVLVRDVGVTPTIVTLAHDQDRRLSIRAIEEMSNGEVWIGTRRGLLRMQDGRVRAHYSLGPNDSGDLVNALLMDGGGRLWIAHQHLGVIVFKTDTLDRQDPIRRPLAFRRNGGAPVRLPERAGDAIAYSTADGLTDSNVTAFHAGTSGLWIGTGRGLTRFDGRSFIGYTTRHGLSSNNIHCLTEDREGGLWIGSPAGAMRLDPQGLISYTIDGDQANLNVAMITESDDGTVYAVGRDWWISRIGGRRIESSRPRLPAGVTSMWASQIAFLDSKSRWWALTSRGLFVFRRTPDILPDPHAPPLRVFTMQDGLPSAHIFRIHEDRQGAIWISTRTGEPGDDALSRLSPDLSALRVLRNVPGIPDGNAPSAFAEDSAGALWIGYYGGGLTRSRGGVFRFFGTADGIPRGAIADLLTDHAGRLWVASGLEGVCCITDPTRETLSVIHYGKDRGLTSDYVRRLAEDRFGRIYASTVRGIDRLDPATGASTHISMHDGLVADFITADHSDSHGDLWFGTVSGLSRLRPVPPVRSFPPAIVITGIRISGDPFPVHELGEHRVDDLAFAHDQRDVTITFSTIALCAARALRYQYSLNGSQGPWSTPTSERGVHFARLAPGTYTFLVRAVTPDGTVSAQPAAVSFAIAPPVWSRWWFQVSAVILLASVLFLLHRWRIRELREIERVRLAIASDLHDEVATNLSSIVMFSRLISDRSTDPAGLLSRITSLATDSVDVIRDIIWSIDPEPETVAGLLARLRDTMVVACRARGIRLAVEIPDGSDLKTLNLTPEQRKNLWMMLKEAVANAIKHSEATELSVSATSGGGTMRFVVADNGRGFTPGAVTGGRGLGTMRMRAGLLGGTMTIGPRDPCGTILAFVVRLRA